MWPSPDPNGCCTSADRPLKRLRTEATTHQFALLCCMSTSSRVAQRTAWGTGPKWASTTRTWIRCWTIRTACLLKINRCCPTQRSTASAWTLRRRAKNEMLPQPPAPSGRPLPQPLRAPAWPKVQSRCARKSRLRTQHTRNTHRTSPSQASLRAKRPPPSPRPGTSRRTCYSRSSRQWIMPSWWFR